MTHRNTVRPAMTAIAAAIALSSAPLFAQTVDEPVVTTTPAPDVTPAPVVADPVVPAPAAETPAAANPPAAKTATPARKATAAKATEARARPTPARAPQPAPTVAAAPAAAITAPVAEVPLTESALSPPAEIADESIAEPAGTSTIDWPSTAALAGLGLLALAGAGLAIRSRRRRRAREAQEAEWLQQQAEAVPDAAAEPAMMVEPEPQRVVASPAVVADAAAQSTSASGPEFIAPETELPENFDISRFGPNMQDAYRGPTEDNPSLSLKTRLSRASGMDQQERKLDAEVEAVTGESVLDEAASSPSAATPDAEPAVAEHDRGDLMVTGTQKKPSVPPTFTN